MSDQTANTDISPATAAASATAAAESAAATKPTEAQIVQAFLGESEQAHVAEKKTEAAEETAQAEVEATTEETADTETAAEPAESEGEASEEVTAETDGPEWLSSHLQGVPDDVLPEGIRKRILKMASKEIEKNAKIRELEAQVSASADAAPPIVVSPTATNPLAGINTQEALESNIETAQALLDAIEDNPEGGKINVNGNVYVYDEKAAELAYSKGAISEPTVEALLKHDKAYARTVLRHAPKRAEWIKQASEIRAQVAKEIPSLYKAGTEERKTYESLVKRVPGLLDAADADLIIADYIAGKKLREERKAGVQTVKVTAKASTIPQAKRPAARPPLVQKTAAPVRPTSAAPDIEQLRKQARNGSVAAQNQLAAAFLE